MALAECLTRICNDGLYKALNLTWDEFCQQHAGTSRAHADEIIRRLEEFGAAYFRLSEIVRISPQSYRTMQATLKGEAIGVGGDSRSPAPPPKKKMPDQANFSQTACLQWVTRGRHPQVQFIPGQTTEEYLGSTQRFPGALND